VKHPTGQAYVLARFASRYFHECVGEVKYVFMSVIVSVGGE